MTRGQEDRTGCGESDEVNVTADKEKEGIILSRY